MAERELNARENLLLAAKMTNNNEIIDVAEVLNEDNDVLQDAIVQKATDITSDVVSRRTALPGSQWVKAGNGWKATTGLLQQVREEIGMQKARFQAPEDVMRIQPNPAKYRQQQQRAYIESMGQEVSNTIFGSWSAGAISPAVAPPEEFAGFSYRYPSLSTARTSYVLNNGSTQAAANTSIWFVQWSPTKVYLTYPRNTDGGGLKVMDKGLQFVPGDNMAGNVANDNMLWAFVTEFSWDVGLSVADTRSVKRLANIDTTAGSTKSLDEDKIIQIRNNFKGSERIFMYCNETVFTQLQILAKDKGNVRWTETDPFGKPQFNFLDMPVRRSDSISNVEAVLTT
jgi:hypothetical protein